MVASTDPVLDKKLWIEYAYDFWSSLTMSPTTILKGCIATLELKSMNKIVIAPNHKPAVVEKPKLPELGNKNITITDTRAPTNR